MFIGGRMINILIVEDSPKEVERYKTLLEKNKNIHVQYVYSAEEALKIIPQNDIDIFILDIELPGINGLELAAKIRDMPTYTLTLIVFITGYIQNQLEAFKQLHCYDYIIKPVSLNEFDKKINKLINQMSIPINKKTRNKMLLYTELSKDILIPIENIRYAEVLHRHCFLYTDLQEEPFESSNVILKELIEEVDDIYFIQCHRSFAVNVKKIQEVEQINYRLWKITLRNTNKNLYVSKKYYSRIEDKLKMWVDKNGG